MAKLAVTKKLIHEFKLWLKQDNPKITEKTLSYYINRLEEIEGEPLTPDLLREFAAKTKWHYIVASRLITFLRKKYRLKELAEELREALGSRPRSGHDTWIPEDNLILRAGEELLKRNKYYYMAYLLMVSSGARLREVHYALSEADWRRLSCRDSFCRLHIDLERGSKNAWALYMPKKIAEYIHGNLGKQEPLSYYTLEKAFTKTGVAAKYYRNWVSNKMLMLGIPEAVIEFITGKTASSVLRKHYLELQYQADTFYPKYAEWLESFLNELTFKSNPSNHESTRR